MNAARYAIFAAAADLVADCSPVLAMTDTMPTGPLISSTDTTPEMRSSSPSQTSRVKSIAVFQLFFSTEPSVFGSAAK